MTAQSNLKSSIFSFTIFIILSYSLGFPADEIIELPGLEQKPTFRQYSGYLDVGNGRHYYYWFVESKSSPVNDPVLLWLSGGPGCSSLGGFWTENGPFRVDNEGKTVVEHPHSWNTLANVLYLESPVGVGYSYDENKTLQNSDDMTAEDNYLALQKFFGKFPQFSNNPFYITGESYAGIYIPMLALKIYKGKSSINLTGVAVGNGAFDFNMFFDSRVKMAYTHNLIDSIEYKKYERRCCQCALHSKPVCHYTNNSACANFAEQIHDKIIANGINYYNIYTDCNPLNYYGRDSPYINDLTTFLGKESAHIRKLPQKSTSKSCWKRGHSIYLNSPNVRKALHIPDHLNAWRHCSDVNYVQQYTNVRAQIKELIGKHQIQKFLVFNGDVDLVCDFLGNQQFVDELGFKVIDDHKKWTVGGRTAGFIKRYKGITFMTVRFAGHMVPTDQPEAALAIVKYLFGILEMA